MEALIVISILFICLIGFHVAATILYRNYIRPEIIKVIKEGKK